MQIASDETEGIVFLATYTVLETEATYEMAIVIKFPLGEDGRELPDAPMRMWQKALEIFLLNEGGRLMLRKVEYWHIVDIADVEPIDYGWLGMNPPAPPGQ